MKDDALQTMLRDADAALAGAPRASADALLGEARRLRQRRAARRAVAASVAAVVLVAAGAVWFDIAAALRRDVPSQHMAHRAGPAITDRRPAPMVPSAEQLREELNQLEREAQLRLRVVRGVTAAPQFVDGSDHVVALSDAEVVRLETARSAAMSMRYAELVEQEYRDVAAARRAYGRIVERFPGTQWADLAVVSLERLDDAVPPSTL